MKSRFDEVNIGVDRDRQMRLFRMRLAEQVENLIEEGFVRSVQTVQELLDLLKENKEAT